MAAPRSRSRPIASSDFRLEEKDMFGDEKIERPTKLARLFSFPGKTSVSVREVGSEMDGKRRHHSPRLISMKDEESGFDNDHGDEMDERKEIGGKRPRRFSFLFAGLTPENDEEYSTSDEDEESKSAQKDDMTTMVLKLLRVRSSRKAFKHKRNVSKTTASFKPRQQDLKLWTIKDRNLSFKLFWKSAKEDSKVNADINTSSPTVAKKSKKTRPRSTSVCDSKFSAISSALSFTSLPHEPLSITSQQSTILLHLLHKVTRSLQAQERLTANFSTNLAHLFARKEYAINANKRLSKEVRKMLTTMMAGLRELVGRTFLKKAVFLQRSLQLCHDFADTLLYPGNSIEHHSSSTAMIPSLPEIRLAITISEIPSTISLPPQHQLDINAFTHTLQTVREDILVQRQLDQALRGGTVGPCEDVRFPATVGERLAMRRFVAFVDGCLVHLERRYVQEGRILAVLECLAGMLKEGIEGV